MLGSVEFSVEYIRLYNLLSRCKGCRSYRKLSRPGVRKEIRIVKRDGRTIAVIRKYRIGEAKPCILACERFTPEEKLMFDVLRFEELKDAYEPSQIDYSEENQRENACAVVDEKGVWVKVVFSSLV